MNIREFRALLEQHDCHPRGPEHQFETCCPAHDDRNPSLSVKEGENGRIVLKCHSGCTAEEIVQALNRTMSDLFPDRPGDANGKPVWTFYDYTDEHGKLVYQVARIEPGKNGKRKNFAQRRPDGHGGWIWNLPAATRKVLYRLPETIAAVDAGETIWIVGGEKDVLTLVEKLGLAATCNVGGEEKGVWERNASEFIPLLARAVAVKIIADNDEAGPGHAFAAAKDLPNAQVFKCPDGHKDVTDLINAGGTLGELIPLYFSEEPQNGASEESVSQSIPTQPLLTDSSGDRYKGRLADVESLLAEPPQPVDWIVEGIVAAGTLTTISAESGHGKSWLAQAFCEQVGGGRKILNIQCARAPALYIDAEMGPRMFIDHRLRPAGINRKVFDYYDAMGLDVGRADDLQHFRKVIEHAAARLVIFDSLRRIAPSVGENDSDAMAPLVGSLAKLARDTHAAIILIHHKGEGEKYYRGSTAIKDQSDALFGLVPVTDNENERVMRLTCNPARAKSPKYAAQTADMFLMVDVPRGGVVEIDKDFVDFTSDKKRQTGPRDDLRESILETLPANTKKNAAERIGRHESDKRFQETWAALKETGGIAQTNGVWTAVSAREEKPTGGPSENANAEASRARAQEDKKMTHLIVEDSREESVSNSEAREILTDLVFETPENPGDEEEHHPPTLSHVQNPPSDVDALFDDYAEIQHFTVPKRGDSA